MRFIVLFFCFLIMTALVWLFIVAGVKLLGTPSVSLSWYAWSLLIVVALCSTTSWILKPWVDLYA